MLALKTASELKWGELQYIENPNTAKNTIERNHNKKIGGDPIINAKLYNLPKAISSKVAPYDEIHRKLENGSVFLVNMGTINPVLKNLKISDQKTTQCDIVHGQSETFKNAADAMLKLVPVPQVSGVVRQKPKQQAKPVKEEKRKREKHIFLLDPESKDDRSMPDKYKVRLLVENETKQYLAVRQNLEVIYGGFSNTCNADPGDTFKIYAFNDYMKDVAEDFKKNRNIKASISGGLIKPLEFTTEKRNDGVLLHQAKIEVPGKTNFKMTRIKQTPYSTVSELTVEHDPGKKWYVLEAGGPDSKVSGKGRIEKGTYQLAPYSSKNYPNEFQLKKVPGRSNIIMYEYDDDKSLTTGLALGTSYDFKDDKKQHYKVDNSSDAKKEIYDIIGGGEAEVVIVADLSLKILKDDLWTNNEHLNLIAGDMSSNVVNKKTPKPSIELVQKAFDKMNVPIIVDGDFGGGSRQAWQFFQRNYPDKINIKNLKSEIDKDGLILMDRALQDNWTFKYDEPKWVGTARGELGQKEIPGDKSNSRIQEYYESAGIKNAKSQNDDDIPWCACFVAWVMKRNGYTPVKNPAWSLNWKKFGNEIDSPKLGALAIKTRKGGGHIGYVVGQSGDGNNVFILGGNQNDEVNIRKYQRSVFTSFVAPEGIILSEAPLYIGKKNDDSKES